MSEALLVAVRGLHVADPDLGVKPLLAKLRKQQPDLLGAGNKEVREALKAVKAEGEARADAADAAAAAAADAATAADTALVAKEALQAEAERVAAYRQAKIDAIRKKVNADKANLAAKARMQALSSASHLDG